MIQPDYGADALTNELDFPLRCSDFLRQKDELLTCRVVRLPE